METFIRLYLDIVTKLYVTVLVGKLLQTRQTLTEKKSTVLLKHQL